MGAYRITRRAQASWGYLETYAGWQASGDKPVLLKHLTQPPASIDRLMENLRVMRGPSLPTVLEVGNANEGLWLAVEAAEGESLRWVMSALARASSFIAPNEGLAVVARVASALSSLHQQHLVHGDVCPTTIFLTSRGEVQLHDGGIAATLGPQGESGPCRSELNALAPEQLTTAGTMQSDVFRLGLVLYELAVGRPLWSGTSPALLCQSAAGWGGLTPQKVKQVPEPWLTLLVTMLSVDPGARPSMEEVIRVLDRAVTQNQWATSDQEIATLFARASQGRSSPFSAEANSLQDVNLSPLTPPLGTRGITPPPGAVVARITTKKMTREMLAVVRPEPAAEGGSAPVDAPLEVRVGHLLLERGKLTRAQLSVAQSLGGELAASLIDGGAVDEDTWVAAAGELTRTPSLTEKKLAEAAPSAEALALVPLALSRTSGAVPLGLKGGVQLMVAMADPMDGKALEQLKAAIGARSFIAFRAGVRALAAARARLYDRGPPSLSPRIIDALLALHGPRGAQAQQLIGLASGLARRLGLTAAEVTLAGLVARAMVTASLASGRSPHEVPKLAQVQEKLGASEADEFIEALHGFPARTPESPTGKAVVLAFAFAAHAGEPRPSGSKLGGALSSFRLKHQLAQGLFEALTAELSQ